MIYSNEKNIYFLVNCSALDNKILININEAKEKNSIQQLGIS